MDIDFPDHFSAAFEITTRHGARVPYQRLSAQKRLKLMRPFRNMPMTRLHAGHTVFADVTVPALGYTTLVYKHVPPHTCPEAEGTMMKGASVLENDCIRLSFQPDGTVTLNDLATGEEYQALHVFEDRGDNGDGWNYVPPLNDTIVSGMSEVSVAITAHGPFASTAVVSGTLMVPSSLTSDQAGRSMDAVPLRVTSTFTLCRGSRRVDVRTTIENPARDHVIKVLFPARVSSRYSFANSMFDVVRRDIRLPSNVGYGERWQENRPLGSFVGIADQRRGLVVFSKGLHEGGVRNDEAQSVFLTLLRCTGKTVMTLGEEGGQMLGRQTLEYAFMPVRDGELPLALAENEMFQNPVMSSNSLDIFKNRYTSTLDDTRSFLSISDSRIILSSLRRNRCGDLILRVFNPSEDTVACDLTIGLSVSRILETNLAEEDSGKNHECADGCVHVTVQPKKILTLLLKESTEATPSCGVSRSPRMDRKDDTHDTP
jgi:hypothetical protein